MKSRRTADVVVRLGLTGSQRLPALLAVAITPSGTAPDESRDP